VTWITLSEAEIVEADACGEQRRALSKALRLKSSNNAPMDDATALARDIWGARGEVAGRNYLAPVKWKKFLTEDELRSGKKLPDLEDWIDVKACRQSHHCLMVQHDNPPDVAYLLICAAEHPHHRVVGWCWGHEAKQERFWEDKSRRNRWAFFVPRNDPILRSPLDLFREVRRRQGAEPGFVGERDGHFVHYCHCGRWGSFGYGASLRKDILGTWYCKDHKPTPQEPLPPLPRPPPPPPAQGDLFAE
jgi:hypothetical protein